MSKSAFIAQIFAAITFLAISNRAEAQPQPNRSAQPQSNRSAHPSQDATDLRAKEKSNIIMRDQIDNTDVYAIPFDDSEVEDEEEINRLEKREVFPLPHSKGVKK